MTTSPSTRPVAIAGLTIGGGAPLALIGGPCAIEDERHALMMAERLQRMTADARVPFIYKSSYDKANRSSVHSYRGPGLKEGLRILARVKEATGLPTSSRCPRFSAGRRTCSSPADERAGP
jgi:2-dehydro-3-deoxyphosphooctonate aldolase (KDO 8-P synthase)